MMWSHNKLRDTFQNSQGILCFEYLAKAVM